MRLRPAGSPNGVGVPATPQTNAGNCAGEGAGRVEPKFVFLVNAKSGEASRARMENQSYSGHKC